MKINAAFSRVLAVGTMLVGLLTSAEAAANVTYEAAVADAMAVVAHNSDLKVMRISGHSMLPFFDDGAVIVVKKIDAAHLRVGMIVVYVNRFGEKVAHRVIAPVGAGWEVKGYNNEQADSTVVNGSNLLGVVYATFYSAGRPPVTVAADHVPSLDTAFAAPAM